jgi:beta-galactosidase
LERLAAMRPGAPLFATEYWPGWFDLYGHPHETRPVAPQLKDIENVLSRGGSINIYMFHGGTNFGMMAGASASTGNYRGNVTSYDYDAPVDEAGHPTAKFFAYRDVILKYTHEKPLPVPEVAPVIAIPEFTLTGLTPLWQHLPKPVVSDTPLTMEQVDQAYGYILYRTKLPAAVEGKTLALDAIHDYAQVYVDGKLAGTLDRHYNQTSLAITAAKAATLDILVENEGRLNSTKNMRGEFKGFHTATLDGQPLMGWQIYSLPMTAPPAADKAGSQSDQGPHFASGSFSLAKTGDSFLDVTALGDGLIWINGHALGRFWNIGPQDTLYVPAPWLKQGKNDVLVFDLFATKGPQPQKLVGRTKPILDGPTPTYADDPERKKKADPNAEFGPKLAAPATNPSSPTSPVVPQP